MTERRRADIFNPHAVDLQFDFSGLDLSSEQRFGLVVSLICVSAHFEGPVFSLHSSSPWRHAIMTAPPFFSPHYFDLEIKQTAAAKWHMQRKRERRGKPGPQRWDRSQRLCGCVELKPRQSLSNSLGILQHFLKFCPPPKCTYNMFESGLFSLTVQRNTKMAVHFFPGPVCFH